MMGPAMKLYFSFFVCFGALTGHSFAQQRPVHTYSIVARDPFNGELGVAVQSHWFSVGSLVGWVRPGVGAAATQSVIEVAHGPGTLAALERGLAPADALAETLAGDELAGVRQVGAVDAQGRS